MRSPITGPFMSAEKINDKREQELIRFLKQDKDNKQVNIIQISLSKS